MSYPVNSHTLHNSNLNVNLFVVFADFSAPERNIKGKSPVEAPNDTIPSPNVTVDVATSEKHFPYPSPNPKVVVSFDVGKSSMLSFSLCTEIGEASHPNVQT